MPALGEHAPAVAAALERRRAAMTALSAGAWAAIVVAAIAAPVSDPLEILALLAFPSALAGIFAGIRAGSVAAFLSVGAILGVGSSLGGSESWSGVWAAVVLAAVVASTGYLAGAVGECVLALARADDRSSRLRGNLRSVVSRAVEGEARERVRLAEELHDGPLQSMLVASQDLGQPGVDPGQVDRARLALIEAIDEMRSSLAAIDPGPGSVGGLERRLEASARRAAARGGFEVTVDVEREAAGHHDALVLSVARELLTNVAKHARAREAVVWVGRSESVIELAVHDDGRGLDPGAVDEEIATGHLGLTIARERVAAIGGDLIVSVPPLGGTIVRALFPLEAALSGEIALLELALARSGDPAFGHDGYPRLGGSEPPA